MTSTAPAIRDLYRSLRAAGLTVWREADNLRLAPTRAVTPDLAARVLAHKPALLDWLANEPRTPVPVRFPVLAGEIAWYAGDTVPIPEHYQDRVVYRTSELRRLCVLTPAALRTLHQDKHALFRLWQNHDWHTRPQIAQLPRRAGLSNVDHPRLTRLLSHLTAAGILEHAPPDGRLFLTDCYRLIPPEERWTTPRSD